MSLNVNPKKDGTGYYYSGKPAISFKAIIRKNV